MTREEAGAVYNARHTYRGTGRWVNIETGETESMRFEFFNDSGITDALDEAIETVANKLDDENIEQGETFVCIKTQDGTRSAAYKWNEKGVDG